MKNIFIGLIFIVILPASFSNKDNSGCNKQKSECTEKRSENKKESKEETDKPENKGQKSAKNEIGCYTFLSVK